MQKFTTGDIISITLDGKIVTIVFRDGDKVHKIELKAQNSEEVSELSLEERKKALL